MEEIVYRKATVEDLNDIIKIGNLIADFEISDAPESFWDFEILENCIDNPESGLILCAIKEGKVAAYTIATFNLTFRKAVIEDLFVLPKYRTLGLAKSLYKILIEEIISHGILEVSTFTEFNNKSVIGFFEKQGFDKTLNNVQLKANVNNI